MATKLNCWEVKNCGMQPGGAKVAELGVCVAAASQAASGLNGGKNGNRICWAVSGTLCGGKVQGSFAQKITSCAQCEFHKSVKREEGAAVKIMLPNSVRA